MSVTLAFTWSFQPLYYGFLSDPRTVKTFALKGVKVDAEGEDGGEQECDERRPRGWRAVTGTRSVGEVVGLSGTRDGVLRDGVQQPAGAVDQFVGARRVEAVLYRT